jgi:CubicO group peptidase (beta-lactamase class C family)
MSEELLAGTGRALRHRLATAQADGRAPAMVAGVTRDAGPRWFGAHGGTGAEPLDETVGFRIGSITKTFTAVLVMRLRDEGRLDLADPIGRHVPEARPGEVTVAQLLAHTAGLIAEPPGAWWERTPGTLRPDVASMLGADPMVHEAGRRFHYSNPGYGLLGTLVERLRGKPWAEALADEILGPLYMHDTGPTPPTRHARGWATHPWADTLLPEPAEDYGALNPAGVLWSTVADLCGWATFLLEGSPQVLSRGTLEEMRRPAAPPEATDPAGGYGLGIQLTRNDGRDLTGHGGSVPGFLASLWVSPADDIGAVVMCNTTAGVAISGLAADLVRIVAEREPRIPAAWEPRSDPALLEIAGPWYWGPAPLAIRVRAGHDLEPTGLAARARATRLRPNDDGTWTGLDGYYAGERLTVVRDASGAVTHLDLGTFVLTREPYDPKSPVPGGVDPDGWRSPRS